MHHEDHKSSLALAYRMKKKKKECHGGQMAEGGEMEMHENEMNPVAKSVKKAFHAPGYAEGGMVHEEKESGYESMPHPCEHCGHMNMIDKRMLNQHGMDEVGAEGMLEDNEPEHERMVSHPVENQSDHEDMVGHIMKKRMKHYSHGGKVSNEDEPIADSEAAEYDDLEKDDDLEEHYTGKNSGDEDGDEQEDEDQRDTVSQIMKSRKKKDKMPRPA